MTEQVAEEVRVLMARKQVNQVTLATRLGLSQSGVSKRLRGITPFDANEIGQLAEIFEVPPAQLLGLNTPGVPMGGTTAEESKALPTERDEEPAAA